jgi:hypothetical protein
MPTPLTPVAEGYEGPWELGGMGMPRRGGGDLEVDEKGEERKVDIQYLFVRRGHTEGK